MNGKKPRKSQVLEPRTALVCIVFLLFILCLFLLLRAEAASILILSFLYIVSIVPKEGMILGSVALLRMYGIGFAVGFTTALSVFLDALISLVVIFQYNTVLKIGAVRNMVNKFTLKLNRHFRNDWKLFLFLFHLVPLQGFGPLVTTVLGKILKMESATVFYIVVSGTAITSALFSVLFFYGLSTLPSEYIYLLAAIVILLPALITGYRILATGSQSKSSPPM
ncbi:MAG: hypothetical protein N3F63_07310 [Thermoplasmata archaeon]|nr:hypothetical protein [Thermoplasmata archaeon]